MLRVRDIAQAIDLQIVAGARGLEREITGGYASDMLSCVMARARAGNIWATLQAHPNIIAVAVMLDLAGVIVTEGAPIADDVIAKANDEGIPLLASPHTTFWVVHSLSKMGVQAQE